MTKFGELVSSNKPVLIDFYSNWDASQKPTVFLRSVVTALGEKAKVIKIDMKKNVLLADALKVTTNPTFIIYKNGEIKWRQTGKQEASTLINTIKQYL